MRRSTMRSFFGREKNWNDHYNDIEAAERGYKGYNTDDNHNQHLIEKWQKAKDNATYYLNKTETQEGATNISETRRNFLEKQQQNIDQAKSQDTAELIRSTGYYGDRDHYGKKK